VQAVDYPKNGIPVDIRKSPHFLIPYKPDWHAAEVASPRPTDYYESQRALGYLYRAIELDDPTALPSPNAPQSSQAPLTDVISAVLKPLVRQQLENYTDPDGSSSDIKKLFQLYVTELTYIRQTYTLSRTQDVLLTEEEIVVGTILAKCSQRRWRKERMHAMRTHVQVLVQSSQRELVGGLENTSPDTIRIGLLKAWAAWDFSLRHGAEFGANSFGLIALGVVFDCLIKLGGMPA
jgi:RNA-dependent RNA polymerase